VRKRVLLKSPVRENRTPGSVRGPLGNWRSYRDAREPIIYGVAPFEYVLLPARRVEYCGRRLL